MPGNEVRALVPFLCIFLRGRSLVFAAHIVDAELT
jgi:hypothetical protein